MAYSVRLTWNDVADETGYKIERSQSPSSGYTQIATVGADVTQYDDGPFEPGPSPVTYYYRVQAYNANGNSEYSNIASVTIPQAQIPPAPMTLTVTIRGS